MSASARIGEGRYIAPAAIPEQTRTSAHELRTHDGASFKETLDAGAQTLRYNGYKVPLMRNLVKRAIRGSEGGSWTS